MLAPGSHFARKPPKTPRAGRGARFGEIKIRAQENRFCFRIAEAAIIFEELLGPSDVSISPKMRETTVRNFFLLQAGERGANDGRFFFFEFRRKNIVRGCHHPSRVGTLVAVEGALVVARRSHGDEIVTVGEDDVGKFLAREGFLDQDALARIAKCGRSHQSLDEGAGFGV